PAGPRAVVISATDVAAAAAITAVAASTAAAGRADTAGPAGATGHRTATSANRRDRDAVLYSIRRDGDRTRIATDRSTTSATRAAPAIGATAIATGAGSAPNDTAPL